jgi:hypothetical protein
VEPWRSDHGVEVIRPRPRGGQAAAGQRDEAFRIDIALLTIPLRPRLSCSLTRSGRRSRSTTRIDQPCPRTASPGWGATI